MTLPQHRHERQDWQTPGWLLQAARRVLGGIDLDPASDGEANKFVMAARYYDDDGLRRDWAGRVWLNPPYGKIGPHSSQGIWLEKLCGEYERGSVTAALLLVNAATDTRWFQRLWERPLCFLHPRVRFVLPGTARQSASPTHASVTACFGSHSVVNQFRTVFREHGQIVIPGGGYGRCDRRAGTDASSPVAGRY